MASTFDTGVDRRGTACIKWDFQEMDYGKSGLLPFSIADADWPTCPAVLDALKRRVDNGVIGYTDVSPNYLSAVADWCMRRHSWKVDPEWIVPTGGIVPAICDALESLTAPGAQVVVQPPVYDPFYSVIRASGRRQVNNPLLLDDSGYHMDYEGLERACQEGAAALILCSPHNPVCRVWTREELSRLADLCARYGLLVISDEIHWDLVLGGREHVTLGQFPQLYDKLIVCTSCSKSFNVAGLDTSNLIIPGQATRSAFRDYLFARYLFCPNALGMVATQAACEGGEAWLEEALAYLTQNAAVVRDFLAARLPKVRMAEPQGTYLMWFDLRAYGLPSEELVRLIADAGAGLNAGVHYGRDYDGFVRMNIACPRAQLLAGLECFEQALNAIEAS